MNTVRVQLSQPAILDMEFAENLPSGPLILTFSDIDTVFPDEIISINGGENSYSIPLFGNATSNLSTILNGRFRMSANCP